MGPSTPRVAEAGGHAGTQPRGGRGGVAKGRGASVRPREPRRGQRRESGVPEPVCSRGGGRQIAPLRGVSTAPAPLYGLVSFLRPRARHGWARRLRSPAGRAGRGLHRSGFLSPYSKAAGDRDGKAKLRTGAPPAPVPVVMPGAVAQHLLPPEVSPRALRGGKPTAPPLRLFCISISTARGGQSHGHPRPPQPRTGLGRGGGPTAPPPPRLPPPPAPEQHAQGSPASLQHT